MLKTRHPRKQHQGVAIPLKLVLSLEHLEAMWLAAEGAFWFKESPQAPVHEVPQGWRSSVLYYLFGRLPKTPDTL